MSANFQKLQARHRARLDKAKFRIAVVDKAEADLEKRVAEAQAWFRQAHKDLKAAQDVLAKRNLELVMKQADIKRAQELTKQQAAQAEAARHHQQAALNSQEEDLAACEEKLAATLHGKDEEVERDELKRQALELTGERNAANGALADAQVAVLSKAGLVSTANESIKDLKLKLEGLEETLSEAKAREGTLAKDPEAEKELRKNKAANHKDFAPDAATRTTGCAHGCLAPTSSLRAHHNPPVPTATPARSHLAAGRAIALTNAACGHALPLL
nr:uncharacterized protein LOC109759093 [Aegilops tauschii subsp. strangulata]